MLSIYVTCIIILLLVFGGFIYDTIFGDESFIRHIGLYGEYHKMASPIVVDNLFCINYFYYKLQNNPIQLIIYIILTTYIIYKISKDIIIKHEVNVLSLIEAGRQGRKELNLKGIDKFFYWIYTKLYE